MATTDRRGISVSAIDSPTAGVPNAGLAIKSPCLVATTGNITLSGLQTIDGVAVGSNAERVLVWQQADATTNGLYNASSGIWTRTTDANSNAEWANGMSVAVAAGAVHAHHTFQVQTPDPITLGSSAITFAETDPVLKSRLINTAAPLVGGGALSSDLSLSLTINGSLQVTGGALAVASSAGATHKFVSSFSAAGLPQYTQPAAADIASGAALTVGNDTNITLTLGGGPTAALLAATSVTVAWTGTLSVARGGTGGGTASGTLLDNITGFSATGILRRTGAGAYSFVANGQLPATATNDSATAGNLGEFISSTIASGSAVSLTTSTPANVTSISLPGGDYDLWGVCVYKFAGATGVALLLSSVSSVTATVGSLAAGAGVEQAFAAFAPTNDYSVPTVPVRISLATTTTVFLVATAQFTSAAGTVTAYGSIYARRAR